ncbi:MAG: HAD family hydrolase [Cytophagales bacterium]|nr:HAD family hydrolase [Armatimonadota bacterium]
MTETSAPRQSAVFLDRDGVLNVYLPGDYVRTPGGLHLLPGAAQAVRALNNAHLPVFIISNQQGVAKGLMTGADLLHIDDALKRNLAESAGAYVEQSYYCPHAASDDCPCRKPKGGMILQAAREHGLDLATSVFIGDTETDAQAARDAGVGAFVLVLTGKHQNAASFPEATDHIAETLGDAVEWALLRRVGA